MQEIISLGQRKVGNVASGGDYVATPIIEKMMGVSCAHSSTS